MTHSQTVVDRPRWVRPVVTLLVVAIAVGAGAWCWVRSNRAGIHFRAQFTSAVGVYPGSSVRVLGVPVGEIDAVRPDGPVVIVSMHLDRGVSVRADTSAAVVSPNLVSDRYVQLTGVYDSGPKLADGARIPVTRTATPVEVDQLYQSLIGVANALGPNGANKSGALSDLLNTAAANLKGNGANLNTTITALSRAARTLTGSQPDIVATITHLESFTAMLKGNDGALRNVNVQLAAVTQVLADDRGAFSSALQQLGSALAVIQSFLHDNRAALSANVAKLAQVAKIIASQQASLAQALRTAPLLAQNLERAYDPTRNVLLGRGDLNELTVWAGLGTTSSSAATPLQSPGPPTLLPGVGAQR